MAKAIVENCFCDALSNHALKIELFWVCAGEDFATVLEVDLATANASQT